MSGWMDDWFEGKIDGFTAFMGWLDAEKSPSEHADEKCGYDARNECWRAEQEARAEEAMRRNGL